jgi:hypothetical protein
MVDVHLTSPRCHSNLRDVLYDLMLSMLWQIVTCSSKAARSGDPANVLDMSPVNQLSTWPEVVANHHAMPCQHETKRNRTKRNETKRHGMAAACWITSPWPLTSCDRPVQVWVHHASITASSVVVKHSFVSGVEFESVWQTRAFEVGALNRWWNQSSATPSCEQQSTEIWMG